MALFGLLAGGGRFPVGSGLGGRVGGRAAEEGLGHETNVLVPLARRLEPLGRGGRQADLSGIGDGTDRPAQCPAVGIARAEVTRVVGRSD